MNNTFILLDKNSNVEKSANMIVKFNFEEKDYLIYSIPENEQNSQIFVSKLIFNSEGKCFIDNILSDEKNKLSNIVYNIVILLPTDLAKGINYNTLVNNLFDKFSVKLLNGLPTLDKQDYYNNCSIAITNKLLVENAIKLYEENLKEVKDTVVPTWTAPLEVTAPTPLDNNITSVQEPTIVSTSIPVQNSVIEPKVPVAGQNVVQENTSVTSEVVNSISTPVQPAVVPNNDNAILPNPQADKLAIISDPSLGIGVSQPNIMQNKKAGFTDTKYVVIGTVCLVLSIAVIITAYILIKNIG